jgi:4-alpha-glucanotransferase
MSLKENYPKPAYYSLLNLVSSHDVERILTAVSSAPDKNSVNKDFMAEYVLSDEEYDNAVKKVKQIVIMQMLMPGVPCIYYGDEIGMQGYGDPFCRQCFDWDNKNIDLKVWYSMAIALRKSSPAFTKGEFENVYKVNDGYGFIRMYEDDMHIVCTNFSKSHECFRLDLARFNIRELELENGLFEEYYNSEDGIYYVQMPAGEAKVFRCRK